MILNQETLPQDFHLEIKTHYLRKKVNTVKAVVFLFHGRGGNRNEITEQLGQFLLQDDIVLVVPEASCNSWYPYRFNEPVEENQPWLGIAINWIHNEIQSYLEQGLSPGKIILGGFSQGGCLALEYPLQYPQKHGGVFCLSGAVIGPLGSRPPLGKNQLAGTPVFLGCADNDEWIPQVNFNESAVLYADSGARVESRSYPGMGHIICKDEIDYILGMIKQVIEQ